MKHKTIFSLLLVSSLLILGCKKKPTNQDPTFDHTVIVYMVADNNLISNAIENINAMESVYDESSRGKILVFYNSTGGDSKIYEIVKDDNTRVISSTVLYEYPEDLEVLNPEVFGEVIDKCRSLSKTDKYSLVLWSHASGWLPDGMSPAKTIASKTLVSSPQRTFGSTYTHDRKMEIYELQQALPADLKFEYIFSDACHMGSIEAAYQLKDNCKYYCASAAEVLADGYPYAKGLHSLLTGDIKGAAQAYYDHYNAKTGVQRSATIAVVETSKLAAVAQELKKLTATDTHLQALQQYGRFLSSSTNYSDLMWDAADMAQQSWDASITANYVSALSQAVIYKAATPMLFQGDYYGTITVNTFSGLSIYIPRLDEPQTLEIYKNNYKWAQDTELYRLAK